MSNDLLPTPPPAMERWTAPEPPLSVRILVSVDNNHCHRYAICQQEAPKVVQASRRARRMQTTSV